ncbi:AAA ATPase-like protein [Rhodopseudomonas thermotolerans]|uniref:AAA ATPase-like protein n=3 Tax=Nitrobacteraceae TaxID=41294 RepID=A0A336JUL1_9BRAD|nr:AAA ATPase-like protein [Rhodopseudomonas pentothenatexigens]REF90380.1 AAA ATPase-like protein [Rhodopseudomonas thermotolerans]SSW93162.1 AAA ATPase-like protein [Rhodopseudomonas pentothenatexigens]
MRRFLDEGPTTFQLEDFSSSCYDNFCEARNAFMEGKDEATIRPLLPAIELNLVCRYDPAQLELGPLAPFVVDLDPTCADASILLRYELKDGAIKTFFDALASGDLDAEARLTFFRTLRERIPSCYALKTLAQDPNDPDNQRLLTAAALRNLVKTGFINAQRGLDDVTTRESDVLAKVLEGLFTTAASPTADTADRLIAEALTTAVNDIQNQIDTNFSDQLKGLMPTLQSFGYPGLGGQEIRTETTLNIKSLLSNFTKVRYAGYGGVPLPESYNGLGVRNLIFILLQLVGFYRAFRAETVSPGMHMIFIEEPEAHLHPQMQEVFIRQLDKIAQQLAHSADDGGVWPVQFVVSTHSSHIANASGFESIRYFLGTDVPGANSGIRQARIKDLRQGLTGTSASDRKFLHQYLTLTRCDLFFADKAILVEGLSERLLLPVMIEKLEAADATSPKLSTQYVTVLEVGGAYAHLFLPLLDFLELRSLIITDLDSVTVAGGTACAVHEGSTTSNACLKAWFSDDAPLALTALSAKLDTDKAKGRHRIAYQCPEAVNGPCGRTFEDAFILANATQFGLAGPTPQEQELSARQLAGSFKKSEFALKYAIEERNWNAPKYILDGVRWLAGGNPAGPDPALALAIAAIASSDEQQNA